MTRKDYRLIADTLVSLRENLTTRHDFDTAVTRFANTLSEQHPNFDRARFMEVCYS